MIRVTVDHPDSKDTTTTVYAKMKDVSDGYHTIGELYEHRMALFLALVRSNPWYSWRSKQHHEGGEPMFDNMFIAGMNLPDGTQISYHSKLEFWDLFDGVKTLDHAPKWDGHTPDDVVERLLEFSAGLPDYNEAQHRSVL